MVRTMLRKDAKIVMTSRDYIYRRARNDLKDGAFPLLRESQVVIDVRDLTLEEKQQILYNHMKLGKQSKPFKSAIKPHLPSVAGHSRFVPETARRLADPLFTSGLHLYRYHLNEFVDKQERFLQEVLQGLDADSKAALALVYMRNDSLESPIVLEESERDALERLGSSLGGCRTALESLSGSLVQYTHAEDAAVWRFKHPTVGDAYAGLLLQSPELLGIYVHGSPMDKLMAQVTCGDIGLERAVVLPKALFPLVLKRLNEFSSPTRYKSPLLASFDSCRRIDGFLSSRCSREFLLQFIERRPDTLARVSSPGLFLNSVSEVDLAIRLHELSLLPEQHRQTFVKTVTSYAIDGDDLYAIDSLQIQSLFTPEELEDFRARIRTELVPNLADVRRTWESNGNSDERPDAYMAPLLDSLSALKKEFADDPDVLSAIDREIEQAQDWISENIPDDSDNERSDRAFGDVDRPDNPPTQFRGIFDDVDE